MALGCVFPKITGQYALGRNSYSFGFQLTTHLHDIETDGIEHTIHLLAFAAVFEGTALGCIPKLWGYVILDTRIGTQTVHCDTQKNGAFPVLSSFVLRM